MTSITLKHPITVDGREVSEISLRRPKVRDLERMDKVSGEMAKAVAMVGDLAELTPDQVREIDAEDFSAVAEKLGDFFRGRPGNIRSVMTDVAMMFGWGPETMRGIGRRRADRLAQAGARARQGERADEWLGTCSLRSSFGRWTASRARCGGSGRRRTASPNRSGASAAWRAGRRSAWGRPGSRSSVISWTLRWSSISSTRSFRPSKGRERRRGSRCAGSRTSAAEHPSKSRT